VTVVEGKITDNRNKGLKGYSIKLYTKINNRERKIPTKPTNIITNSQGILSFELNNSKVKDIMRESNKNVLKIYFVCYEPPRNKKIFDTKGCIELIWKSTSQKFDKNIRSDKYQNFIRLLSTLKIKIKVDIKKPPIITHPISTTPPIIDDIITQPPIQPSQKPKYVIIKGRITDNRGIGVKGLVLELFGLKKLIGIGPIQPLPRPFPEKKIVTDPLVIKTNTQGKYRIKIAVKSLESLRADTSRKAILSVFMKCFKASALLFSTKNCIEGLWDGKTFKLKRYPNNSTACKKLLFDCKKWKLIFDEPKISIVLETPPKPPKPVILLPMKLEIRDIDNKFKIRWYPDEIHIPVPIGKITQDELNDFKEIYQHDDLEKCATELRDNFSVIRSKQLARYLELNGDYADNGIWDFDKSNELTDPTAIFIKDGIIIPTLPKEVLLYTLKDDELSLIAKVAIIRNEVKIQPMDVETDNWMTNFGIATDIGMGIEVTGANYSKIKNADWLFVVGLNDNPNGYRILENIFQRRNAAGQLAIIPQDSPTNNTETAKSPYTNLESDLVKYFEETKTKIPMDTPSEPIQRISQNKLTTDAQILTETLGMNHLAFSEIPGSYLTEQDEAVAMSILLWNSCTHILKDEWKLKFDNITDSALPNKWQHYWKFFINNIRARGNLPIIAVDDIPYGVLPIISLDDYKQKASENNTEKAYQGNIHFVSDFCKLLKKQFLELSNELSILSPVKESNSFEKLLDILRTNRVSKRLDVRLYQKAVDISHNERITYFMRIFDNLYTACELVKSKDKTIYNPITSTTYELDSEVPYLHLLASDDISDSIKSQDLNRRLENNPPVLERLLLYFYQKIDSINDPIAPIEQHLIKKAAKILAKVHPDKLELLLTEFMDLFSHRVDAYASGIAYDRLVNDYLKENKKPQIGLYGWLEKPGQFPETEEANAEYIQTPSLAQANTAAILRNASLNSNNENDAFKINLSSTQVRKGLWYLEGLRQRHLPGELFGYKIERTIHDQKELLPNIGESDLYELRRKFPLPVQKAIDSSNTYSHDERTFIETVINGEEFLDADLSQKGFSGNKLLDLIKIQNKVNEVRDAAADIGLAEVMYQFLQGNASRTAAWLDFLDGDVIPPKPEFIRSTRTGEKHAKKVYFLVDPPSTEDELKPLATTKLDSFGYPGVERITFPRFMASPVVNKLCNSLLSDFSTTDFAVCFQDEKNNEQTINLKPRNDLSFEAIDLIVGGEEELLLRTRYYLLEKWKNNDAEFITFGKLTPELNIEEQLNLLTVTFTINETFSTNARSLRNMLQKAKQNYGAIGIEPNDEWNFITDAQLSNLDLLRSIVILDNRVTTIFNQIEFLHSYFEEQFKTISDIGSYLNPLRDLFKSLENFGKNPNELEKEFWIKLSNILDQKQIDFSDFKTEIETEFTTTIKINDKINELLNLELNDQGYFDLLKDLKDKLSNVIENISDKVNLEQQNDDFKNQLKEISRYGYFKALTPLPECLTNKIYLDMLKNLVKFLNDKKIIVESRYDDFKSVPADEKIEAFKAIIECLRYCTDGDKTIVFIPYVQENIANWDINFDSDSIELSSYSDLSDFAEVRKDISKAKTLFESQTDYKLFLDEYEIEPEPFDDPTDPSSTSTKKYGTMDYLYVSKLNKTAQVKCLACLLIDDWWEFYPNMVETTGIAYRYDAPQLEAPNAILIAVPPDLNETNNWQDNHIMLAKTLKEAVELMRCRMVGPTEISNNAFHTRFLPLTMFEAIKLPNNNIAPLFPTAMKPLPKNKDLPLFDLRNSVFSPVDMEANSSSSDSNSNDEGPIVDSENPQFTYVEESILPSAFEYLKKLLGYTGPKAERNPIPKLGGIKPE